MTSKYLFKGKTEISTRNQAINNDTSVRHKFSIYSWENSCAELFPKTFFSLNSLLRFNHTTVQRLIKLKMPTIKISTATSANRCSCGKFPLCSMSCQTSMAG